MMTAPAAALGAPRPRVIPSWLLTVTPYAKAMATGGLRVSAAKAKQQLGRQPSMPTYRDGVDELAGQYRAKAA